MAKKIIKLVPRAGTAARPSATTAAARASRPATSPPSAVPEPPPVVSARPFKVEAIAMGYYEHTRRRPGDVFEVYDERHFSSRWMRRVDPNTPTNVTLPNEAIAREHNAILRARHPQPGIQVGPDNVPADLPTGEHNPLGEDI